MGFRPKPGTILYSPSRHYMYAFKDAWKNFDKTKMIVITEDTKIRLASVGEQVEIKVDGYWEDPASLRVE